MHSIHLYASLEPLLFYLQAGMSGFTTLELVAAVFNAEGLGILGANLMMPEQFGDED
jgi:NAD(P)H-dependent flavin oxidoreductase YrpB (nitropropane dioxygenase family)